MIKVKATNIPWDPNAGIRIVRQGFFRPGYIAFDFGTARSPSFPVKTKALRRLVLDEKSIDFDEFTLRFLRTEKDFVHFFLKNPVEGMDLIVVRKQQLLDAL